MKKLFTLILSLIASIGTMLASDIQVDGIWYDFDANLQTASVTYRGYSYDSYSNEYTGSVAIPSSVEYNNVTYSVTSIGEDAFCSCTDLTSIEIPNSVITIGNYAFSGTGLTSLEIPNSVTSIGNSAFRGCTSLTSIVVENGNITYDSRDNCNAIIETNSNTLIAGCKSSTIPNSVTNIGDAAFSYCSGLTSIEIPNSVTSLGNSAFYGCSGLTSIDIPNSVTSIKGSAFSSCSSLTSVTIGNGVTSIEDYAFYGCSSLTSVTIGNGVTSIEDYAFYGCSDLTSVTWNARNYNSPSTYIDAPFFRIGSQLTSFTFGEGVETIPAYLCYGMDQLTSITIPNSVTSIVSSAFKNCSSLTSVTWNARNCNSPSSKSNAPFYWILSQITSFTFGEEVETIPAYLCYGMNQLTSITIPNSVTSIGRDALYVCSSLTSVTWNARNCNSPSSFTDAPFGSQITSFTFGEEVETIPAYLCYGMNQLTSITIPNSVTRIRKSVFEGCTGLTSIEIPNSVTSMGSYTFAGCSGLTSVTIPNSVTSIGRSVFYGCSSLTSIEIPNSVITIGNYAFSGTGLTSLEIPNSVTSFEDYAFYGCSSLTSVTWNARNCNSPSSNSHATFSSQITSFKFGEEVETIPAYLCYGMNQLTSITIPNSVTSIGNSAFRGCTSLTSIVVENGNITYDSRDNCNAIIETNSNTLIAGCKSTTIPNSVTSIGSNAFSGCSSLTSIEIPNSVITIGNYAFSGTGLTSLEIPNSVTSLGNSAFNGCSGLTSIEIPNSVTTIGNYAFAWCSSLMSVTNYASTPQAITSDVFYSVNKSIPLYVIDESVDLYKAADEWNDFTNILPIEETPTDINPTTAEQSLATTKFLRNGQILILRGDKTYTIQGQQIK